MLLLLLLLLLLVVVTLLGFKGFSTNPQKLLRYLGSSPEGFSKPTLISRFDILEIPEKNENVKIVTS